MKRALCIWLPDWPIQRLTLARPELKEQPVGLHETRIPYDPPAEREALEALAERCGRFSPIVAVEESVAPDSLLLDITGLAHLFDGEAALAEQIIHDFTRRGLTVRVAIADTLGAAWAVAHFHSAFSIQHSAFILVPSGEILTALRPLPVEALRLPGEVVELLRPLGVDRIGQLEVLPRGELSARFGPQLLRRWDQAIGRLAEPVRAHRPAPDFQAGWSPEHPTARRETIEAALEQSLTRVAAMLVRRGLGALRLECRLDYQSGGPVRVSVGLFEPTASAGHLFQLVRMQLERLRLPAPVSRVHVAATATVPLVRRQQELFFHGDGTPRPSSRHLAALIDRLSSRLGRRSVVSARLGCDAQPELAWHCDPLLEGARHRTSRKKAPAELPPRPLRLLPRPIALCTTSIMPGGLSRFSRSENGTVPFPDGEVPLRLLGFHYSGRSHRIAHTWGPERIETGWWRGRTVGRDYYQIETTTGRRYWLFRRLRDGRWFLHGMFE